MAYWAKLLIIFSHLPVFITVGYTLAIYKNLEGGLKVFSYFLFFSGIIQLISLILWYNNQNNLPLLHLYVPIGFICLCFFYKKILAEFIHPNIIWLILILFTAFSVINTFFFQHINTYNSSALTVESILLIILSLSTFLFLLNSIFKEYPSLKSINWINSGIFIYYSSSLLIFYFGDYLASLSPSVFLKYTWLIHAIFSIIMYIFFFLGLWKRQTN